MGREFPRIYGRMDKRVALVTGASTGIGAGIAEKFVRSGAKVYAVARRIESITEWAPEGSIESGQLVPLSLDVSDSHAVAELGSRLAATDPIDTLVCAAGVNITNRRVHQLTVEAWDDLIRINLNGVFYCFNATMDQLRDSQGDFVVISSVAGSWPDHSGAAYGASKSGVIGFARGVGIDEHANGIRVTTVLPGIVNTPILSNRPIPPSDELREWMVQPEDIAEACLTAVTLPARTNIAEMTVVATRLQTLAKTQAANPELPESLR